MKTALIWLLTLCIIQVITILLLAYFNPNKPSTMSELFDELKSVHWVVWIPCIGLVAILLALIFAGCEYLWHKFVNLRIRR